MKKDFIKYGAIIFIVVLFGVFVWPGIYRYDKLNQKSPVRMNRITGKTEVLYTSGWESIDDSKKTSTTTSGNFKKEQSSLIMIDQKEMIIGDITIRKINMNKTSYSAELVNSSSKTITLSSMEIQTYGENGSPLANQPFSRMLSDSLNPNETSVVSFAMGAIPLDQVSHEDVKKQNPTIVDPWNQINNGVSQSYSSYKINIHYTEN